MAINNLVFPSDSKTVFQTVSGNITTTTVSGNNPKTVLGVAMQQQKDLSDTILRCGTTPIAKNYGKDLPQIMMNYVCHDTINIVKTGNDEANVTITYLNYDVTQYATTSSTTINTGDVTVEDNPTFSFQEGLFIMAVFLFIISYNVWGKLNFFKTNNV